MSIQSTLNPYWNSFLAEEYSGSSIESDLSYLNQSTPIPNSTVASGINSFGNLLISSIILQYNLKYGTNYSNTDFGIVPLTNDQNSRCGYLIFPLSFNCPLLFRVYLELGRSFEIGFTTIKYIASQTYVNPTTQENYSNTIKVMRCNVLMNPLFLNQYKVIPILRDYRLPKRILSSSTTKFLFCPIPYNTTLFDVLPETFNLEKQVPYIFTFEIG